jgi:hypothetical protein
MEKVMAIVFAQEFVGGWTSQSASSCRPIIIDKWN